MASTIPARVYSLARHRQLAPTASVRVSPMCLGTMNFGDAFKARMGECSKDTAFDILDLFVKHGGNFIDTANGYQNGQSETWLGEWMASRKNRDEMVIATKYAGPYKQAIDAEVQVKSNYSGNGTKSMRLSLEASLRRLQTSYVDIFYLHFWDYTVTIPELMHSLHDLVTSGKVLYLGISDTPAWVVAKANQYARSTGLRQFSVYQGLWNASIRDIERDIIPMCLDEGMGLVPWGVLNQGRFQSSDTFAAREKHNEGRKFGPVIARDKQVSQILEEVAHSLGSNTTITQVALAYVRQKCPYVFPVVGGRNLNHVEGNIEAMELLLTDEQVIRIDLAYPFDPGFPHTFLRGTLLQGPGAVQKGAYIPADVSLTKDFGGVIDFVEGLKPITKGSKP